MTKHSSTLKNRILLFSMLLTILHCSCLIGQSTDWNESQLKEYWRTHKADNIEGFYKRKVNSNLIQDNKLTKQYNYISEETYYIVKSGNSYILSSFDGSLRATLTKSQSSAKTYLAASNIKYFTTGSNQTITIILSYSNGVLRANNFRIALDSNLSAVINDVFLSKWKPAEVRKNKPGSGTGFAISSKGYLVTNFHVIENAESIMVKGVNGDLLKKYKAQVVLSDRQNDLAILKITDVTFSSIDSIPYNLRKDIAEVGEGVFVLGYPMINTMGEEIKLTNGIISSRTGFQGDVSSYQISAPVQPGNSGGPLFDQNGNIIGVVSAKHVLAENAGYAIKVNYLNMLLELLPNHSTFPKTTFLSNKTLMEQVKLVSRFVYVIEVY